MVIYLDSGKLEDMETFGPTVSGFTTNPTLIKGVSDYKTYAKNVLKAVSGKPVSFEVFADTMEGMEIQAREICDWGPNVYVKIPVCNTKGLSTANLITDLAASGIKVNVTAIMCYKQIDQVMERVKELGW